MFGRFERGIGIYHNKMKPISFWDQIEHDKHWQATPYHTNINPCQILIHHFSGSSGAMNWEKKSRCPSWYQWCKSQHETRPSRARRKRSMGQSHRPAVKWSMVYKPVNTWIQYSLNMFKHVRPNPDVAPHWQSSWSWSSSSSSPPSSSSSYHHNMTIITLKFATLYEQCVDWGNNINFIFMRGQNSPRPPLNNMLIGVITSTISPRGIKHCYLYEQYVDWGSNINFIFIKD